MAACSQIFQNVLIFRPLRVKKKKKSPCMILCVKRILPVLSNLMHMDCHLRNSEHSGTRLGVEMNVVCLEIFWCSERYYQCRLSSLK